VVAGGARARVASKNVRLCTAFLRSLARPPLFQRLGRVEAGPLLSTFPENFSTLGSSESRSRGHEANVRADLLSFWFNLKQLDK
jgi:hypothetical protein